jgi:dipeptidyl-peptidase-4
MKIRVVFTLSIWLFLAAACMPLPASLPAPTAVPVGGVSAGWQTYSNPLGFSIRYPAAWSQKELPQQAGETIHTVTLEGTEGAVNLRWGTGFGGACPQGYTTVKVAEGELSACYSKNADGTEVWAQIDKQLEATSFSADAHTNNADPASHDLVLQVLSTLSFPPSRTIPVGPEQSSGELTARMLTAPNALVGPSPSSFNWSPVGTSLAYVGPQDGQDMLWLYDAATGAKKLLLDPAVSPGNIDVTSAQWSPQGDRLLLAGDEALWLLDVRSGDLKSLVEDGSAKTGLMFTPDGARISYVQDNDLYVVTIADDQVQRLTTDGGETVFNGALDWVYNEELATRAAQPAYAWSPDGVWLIYLRLDESAVHNDPVTDYRPVPATVSYTRYPTVGTANPTATLYAMAQGAVAPPLEVPLPADAEYVLPFFTWTPDSNHALYITVNRDHTELTLNMWTPQSGELRTLIKETDPTWINEDRYVAPVFIGDDLSEAGQFLWLSERDGFMHLYLYARDGTLVKQLTQGDWMIDSSAYNLLTPGRPVHVDPAGSWAYFTTTRTSPLERQIDRVNIASGQLEQVSQQPGFHLSALSGDDGYLVDQYSDVDTPPVTQIVKTDGSGATVLAEAAGPALTLPELTREFVTLKAHDGTDLYAQLVKPENFDPARKYPVVVHWYGGPGLQMVSNRYGTTNIFNIIERDVLYTQEGFLVWRLDNRGSFGRGHAFETPIFGELGKAALDDQLAGIEYLKTLPYVDASRIGTDGKSFGGYMTLYALLHAPDVFRCGVAGAAPTDWSYYDTIYTERYMRTPDKNPDGYAATNLIDMAGQIQARPLLIHGLADTNVHLQNTVNFIQALEANDKLFDFIPLPNLSHSFKGDGLVAALSASADYLAACLGN